MSGRSSPEFQLIDNKIQLQLEATENLKKTTRGLTGNPSEINMIQYEN